MLSSKECKKQQRAAEKKKRSIEKALLACNEQISLKAKQKSKKGAPKSQRHRIFGSIFRKFKPIFIRGNPNKTVNQPDDYAYHDIPESIAPRRNLQHTQFPFQQAEKKPSYTLRLFPHDNDFFKKPTTTAPEVEFDIPERKWKDLDKTVFKKRSSRSVTKQDTNKQEPPDQPRQEKNLEWKLVGDVWMLETRNLKKDVTPRFRVIPLNEAPESETPIVEPDEEQQPQCFEFETLDLLK